MGILLQVGMLILGFVLLIKGADFFVDGAAGIAKRFGIPEIIVGLTIVAIGTSAPEAAVSITAALTGNGDITMGNILGSNILNILVILGVTAVIAPVAIGESTVKIEMPFLLVITVLMVALGKGGNVISRIDGVILWVFFLIYMGYLLYSARGSMKEDTNKAPEKQRPIWQLLIFTVLGMVMIVVGSDFTVDGATAIAEWAGVSQRVIGLTVVALGTSLPELVTSATAASKGNPDIAIGNIVGSNVFNILFVVGTSALITNITFPDSFLLDSVVNVGAVILLMFFAFKDRRLGRVSGIVFLACYAVYLAWILMH